MICVEKRNFVINNSVLKRKLLIMIGVEGKNFFFLRRLSACSATCNVTWDAMNDTK